ncbi:hypothetical protein [Nesterenkonia alkaliphila]|uniref:Uncharacterized protein n=1 Tax=Nesterenkonia alkaliphila TaxID=1463631 RepID=A0A7K1ULL5_9MICC|nr:hypothetical protein [Nesterenkonia alkaliphila]MVT27378.1 hypothetical protein [Nesterenkonia alkaliphila]GFZ80485.1 hypothetical protein GCM10011359_06110 [Nesterenkonia alkaliphila]
MSTPAQRLKAARGIHLGREGAPTAGDRWFSLYLIGFVTAFYILPVVYVVGDFLDPDFALQLTQPQSEPVITAALTLLAVAALWTGRIQGPVLLTPFLAHTLLGTDIPRRRVLLLPTLKAVACVGMAAAGLAAVGLFALTLTGVWDWDRFGLLVAAAFAGGVQLALLAFLGQRLSLRALLFSAVVISAAGALGLVFSEMRLATPAGWSGLLWTGGAAWPVAALALTAAAGVILIAAIPAALDRLPAARVLNQSRRISEARLFTSTGSINDAVELFRSKPAHRFHRVPVTAGPAALSGLRQDLISALRSPLSLLGAAVLVPAGAALLTLAAPAAGESFQDSNLLATVPLGVAGAVLLFLGTGSLSEGWRQLKNEFDAAALFGWSSAGALGRRLLWPVLTSGVLTTAGAAGVVVLPGSAAQWKEPAWTLAVTAAALAARFFQSMRSRNIPVEFLAPTVIPGRVDLSAVKILLWLGDGIIITVTAVLAVVVLPLQPSTLVGVLGALILTVMIWGWARTGVQMTAGPPRPV